MKKTKKREAELLTVEEELLWQTGQLDNHCPQALADTMLALRDHFVCGLGSKAIQNCLLDKKELKAVNQALAMGTEAVAKEVTELQATSTADAASGASKKDVLKVTVNCYRCGKLNHNPINRLYARYALRHMRVHVIKREIRLKALALLLLCYSRAHNSIVD